MRLFHKPEHASTQLLMGAGILIAIASTGLGIPISSASVTVPVITPASELLKTSSKSSAALEAAGRSRCTPGFTCSIPARSHPRVKGSELLGFALFMGAGVPR